MTIADNKNFYQSSLRTHINADVFMKPTFYVDFDGSQFQVVCKEKTILGVIIVWFQVLGIGSGLFNKVSDVERFKNSIMQGAKSYYNGKRFYPLSIQCGFTNILRKNEVFYLKNNELECVDSFLKEKMKSDNQKLSLGLKPSKKHNLPDSTIIINLSESRDTLWSHIGRNTKEKIKKTEKLIQGGELVFKSSVDVSDYDLFFDLYCKTAGSKGFGAITLGMRQGLKKSALEGDFVRLFVVKNTTGDLISAAFCIIQDGVLTYLYGANSRSYGNAGVSQYLHRKIIIDAKDNDVRYYDLLGASALGSRGDRLEQVTQFKLGFGGEKIEYAGSRDIILSTTGYYLYTLL